MIFVDTGGFLARHLPRDRHHDSSREAWGSLASGSVSLLTSNFVLDETFTLLGRWASYDFAADRAVAILRSENIEILRPDADDELADFELWPR